MTLLTISDLGKSFGTLAAVDGLALSVAPGQRTAVVGPSGCGKTTLLRLIAGFERPDRGRIALDGQPLAGAGFALPAHRRGIGLMAQDGALFPHLSVAENIGFAIPRAEADRPRQIAALAELVGLPAATLPRPPHTLSGGQQQRVALARALARRPKLLLLDEPFSALDTGLRAALRRAVAETLDAAGVTAILVTHDQSEALSFAAQVAIMQGGRFAQVGTPRELYFHPHDRRVAEFLGEAVILPARIAGGAAETALGRIALSAPAPDGAQSVMLRPEQIAVRQPGNAAGDTAGGAAGEADGDAAGDTPALARVLGVDFAGPASALRLALLSAPPACPAELLLRCPSLEAPAVGATVALSVAGRAHPLAGEREAA